MIFDVEVEICGASLVVAVYDPIRLSQDLNGALAKAGYAFSSRAVVVPELTRSSVTESVSRLAQSLLEEAGGTVPASCS